MARTQRHELEAWLGPALADLTDGQVDAIADALARYENSPPVAGRDGEPADYAEEDTAVLAAITQHVLGELDLDALGVAARRAREVLYAGVVGAVHAGVPEAEAARRAGVDRMTVRRLLGKR